MPAKGASRVSPSASDSSGGCDVVVIGGGVIGLSIAWAAALRGLTVTVLDPAPGSGASHHAAGMLAPVTEVHYGEEDLLRLNLAAAQRYPSFVAELEEAAGTPVGYRACGTLAVAFDADDKAALDDLHRYQTSLGLASHPMSAAECRQLEPFLATSVRGGLMIDGDHQVDNRRLVGALLAACVRAGVDVRREPAHRILVRADRVTGVDDISAAQTVLAAGCWSGRLAGLPPPAVPPVRPVKGQILRLRDDVAHPVVSRNVRAFVRGRPLYLAPRSDGEVVLGATSEEQGFDTRLTVEGCGDLVADARVLLPRIAEMELAEASVGLRPGSPDNAPMIGASGLPGLVVATGHYRNGILLAPVTADAIAGLLAGEELPGGFERFDPCRFASVSALTSASAPA
jgi:glycine oxidase